VGSGHSTASVIDRARSIKPNHGLAASRHGLTPVDGARRPCPGVPGCPCVPPGVVLKPSRPHCRRRRRRRCVEFIIRRTTRRQHCMPRSTVDTRQCDCDVFRTWSIRSLCRRAQRTAACPPNQPTKSPAWVPHPLRLSSTYLYPRGCPC